VRRHHFAGGAATHGRCSIARLDRSARPRFRRASSKHARRGTDGRRTRDDENLKVLRVDAENHLLIVEGSVPGAPSSYWSCASGRGEEDQDRPS